MIGVLDYSSATSCAKFVGLLLLRKCQVVFKRSSDTHFCERESRPDTLADLDIIFQGCFCTLAALVLLFQFLPLDVKHLDVSTRRMSMRILKIFGYIYFYMKDNYIYNSTNLTQHIGRCREAALSWYISIFVCGCLSVCLFLRLCVYVCTYGYDFVFIYGCFVF